MFFLVWQNWPSILYSPHFSLYKMLISSYKKHKTLHTGYHMFPYHYFRCCLCYRAVIMISVSPWWRTNNTDKFCIFPTKKLQFLIVYWAKLHRFNHELLRLLFKDIQGHLKSLIDWRPGWALCTAAQRTLPGSSTVPVCLNAGFAEAVFTTQCDGDIEDLTAHRTA